MKRNAERQRRYIQRRRRREQADTAPTTPREIMRHPDFRAGFNDVRAGHPPRFDEFAAHWEYERGRHYAVVAPRDLPLFVGPTGHKLNPDALLDYTLFLFTGGAI